MHRHEIPDATAFDSHPRKTLAGVLVAVEAEAFGDAVARAEQGGEQRMT